MARKKFDIYNIEMTNEDMNLIKLFIDLYDDCQEKYNEYIKLCDQINKDERIKESLKNNDLKEAIKKTKMSILNKMLKSEKKEELEELKKECIEYEKQYNSLEKYEEIIKIYNDIYSGNLSKYFKEDSKMEEIVREKYKDYNEEELREQIEIEKKKQLRRKQCTITQVYVNVKYLYEICTKIYEKPQRIEKKGIISLIKEKIQKLRIKKSITKIEQDYIRDNEMYLARINMDYPLFIDIESLESNLKFYKSFKIPISEFVNENNNKIKEAKRNSEKEEEVYITDNMTILTRQEKIDELKNVKKDLTKKEEIVVPVKTA